MSINSISFNDPNFDINKASTASGNTASSASGVSAATPEDALQSLELSDGGGSELQNLSEQHNQKIRALQEELNQIRQQKQSLLMQMSSLQAGEDSSSITSQISQLNSQSNSVYMEIINQMQSYNTSLQELAANSVRQKVEDSMTVQNTLNAAAPAAAQSVNVQSSLAGYNTSKGQAIAQSAHTVDGTVGWCLKGVNDSLERVYGARLSYNSAYQAIPELQGNSGLGAHFKEVNVSRDELTSLPPGAIVVWEASAGHQHGHISIALGDGRESSDHITSQMTGRDANYHVFIPVS